MGDTDGLSDGVTVGANDELLDGLTVMGDNDGLSDDVTVGDNDELLDVVTVGEDNDAIDYHRFNCGN